MIKIQKFENFLNEKIDENGRIVPTTLGSILIDKLRTIRTKLSSDERSKKDIDFIINSIEKL